MRLIKGPPLRFVAPSLRAQRRTANATTAPFDARRLMALRSAGARWTVAPRKSGVWVRPAAGFPSAAATPRHPDPPAAANERDWFVKFAEACSTTPLVLSQDPQSPARTT